MFTVQCLRYDSDFTPLTPDLSEHACAYRDFLAALEQPVAQTVKLLRELPLGFVRLL